MPRCKALVGEFPVILSASAPRVKILQIFSHFRATRVVSRNLPLPLSMKQVDSFLNAVRLRLNRNRAFRAGLWAVIAGAGVLFVVALVYVFRGYAVPRYWYGIAAGATAAGAIAGALARRTTVSEASEFADGFFGLKDSITSHRRFEAEQRHGGYYDLQAGQTSEVVRPLDPARVPFVCPRGLASAAVVLVMACGLTAFKSTDQEILDRLRQEEVTFQRTEELKRELEEMVKELEKGADAEEEKLLNPDQLKEFVDQLKSTKDLAEAMRQLADLERKLDKAARALDQKRDEQLLKKAGEELEKEEDPQARELARNLKNEKFKDAAKDTEKFKPSSGKDKKLSEKRKDAAKLKAAAKRMAAAARSQKSSQTKNSKESGDDKEKAQTAQDSKAQEQEDELSEDLEKLEMEADEYDKDLEELEEGEKLGKIDLSKLEKSDQDGEKLRVRLDKLGKDLAKLGMKADAKKKLLTMGKKAGQGQGYLQGQSPSPFSNPGGKKPGDGTIETTRNQKDELKDNGQTTQLKGQKGTGPSLTKIEAADDGTGTSHAEKKAVKEGFRKQFESFVQREDVPEDVKDGVKHYFEALHDAEPAGTENQTKEEK